MLRMSNPVDRNKLLQTKDQLMNRNPMDWISLED